VRYAYHMEFLSETSYKAAPCYKILDDDGRRIASIDLEEVDKDFALKMYSDMVTVQVMDTIFYEAQRQGRISFYLTSIGEEAIGVGSAAGLSIEDVLFAQVITYYRYIDNIFKLCYICPRILITVPSVYSIEKLEYYFGEVSHCKSLQINALETELAMEREDKCLYTMDPVL